ncbi:family 43 glycosylhydrolase [Isoptericola croceus]|uniref:beta-xylosidase family glycoside hydrolase n=1 Tax=Isoptericola croceus TaxID=3031406 RepID=UPI0023F9BE73|nr:family 43 glycosylhydrolase [Isoptericola croceus]
MNHRSSGRSLRALLAGALTLGLVAPIAAAAVAVTDEETGATPVSTAETDLAAYVFPYFAGERSADDEKIYLAVSESDEPTAWQTLNAGEPVLESTLGTEGLRDPFIIRAPEDDTYYLIATDLQIYGGGNFGRAQETGSRSLMVWESTDLVNWSDQREAEIAPENAGNLWAPEAYWDEAHQEFLVFWASALYPDDVAPEDRRIASSYQRMMYATTTDFVEFSEPEVWIDMPRGAGRGMIDSTIVEEDGTYYRFTKDEADMTVRQESSDDLRLTQGVSDGDGWDLIAERIGVGEPNPWGGTFTSGEGPTVFPSLTDDRWYMMIDQPSYHGGQGYLLFESDDLTSGEWTSVPDAELPRSPRHGTVIPITAAEQAALLAAYPPAEEPEDVVPGPAPELGDATWSDDFTAAELDSRWKIHAEDASAWSVGEGNLTLQSRPGDTWQNDNAARNIFLVDVPAGDFSAVTHVTAPVSLDFQGAGLIAWADIDNYVRAGLSHVGLADGGPVVIESALENARVFTSEFTPRRGSQVEWLRIDRVGDELVVSYGDSAGQWAEAARFTVDWDVTQVGLYALAAQNGTSHTAEFSTFWLSTEDGGSDDEPLAVEVEAEARCAGSRGFVAVRVANGEGSPVGAVVETPYGTREKSDLEAGKSTLLTFSVRDAQVPAGAAVVTVTGDGGRSARIDVPFEGVDCS